MKPYLQQQLDGATDIAVGLPIVREYLQARILEGFQQAGAFTCLAFHGGTSLRFLYDIPRFSEDLDFALEGAAVQFDFHRYLSIARRNLAAENYSIEVRTRKEQPVVHKAFFRFPGLLYDLGLSPYRDQVVAIKVEIDTNPPPHAVSDTTLLKRHVDLHLRHHDRATLLAGKLQAVLNRAYVKGRDWYDLWWYLRQSSWPPPNFAYLNSGLRQANNPLPELSEDNWRTIVYERTAALNWSAAYADVEPFIMEIDKQSDFSQEQLMKFLVEK